MKLWIVPPKLDDQDVAELSHLKPLHQQILINRGLTTKDEIEAFFNSSEGELQEPSSIPDMESAISRLHQAREQAERLVIYGDYDADGVTATALLVGGLSRLGLNVRHYIPNRFDHGYGVNREAVQEFGEEGVDLVITVDCGVRAIEEIALGTNLGVDFIVTDHHHPGGELPKAVAVVNPRRIKQEDRFKAYSGVGIAYLLLSALAQDLGAPDVAEEYLDLVAIGTVADLAPLVSDNRTLVSKGLEILNRQPRPGLQALIETSGFKPGKISSTSIAFGLAPRLNAAGRLDSAEPAYQLLVSADIHDARPLAAELEKKNRDRRRMTDEAIELARAKLEVVAEAPQIIIAMDEAFNEGVVGLAASRLVEEYYRPAVVAALDGDGCRGSARSIPEFHITDAFEQCSDLLLRFGGHAAAAGFEASEENIPHLLQRLNEIAIREMGGKQLHPSLEIDAFVGFNEIDDELMAFLERLEPSGMDNPRPVLATRKVEVISKRTVGANGAHLKLALNDGRRYFDCIAFRMGDFADRINKYVDVAYRPEWNDYMGVRSLQLNIEDISPID
jgi:single-stranded-DNA-specific exonuclease